MNQLKHKHRNDVIFIAVLLVLVSLGGAAFYFFRAPGDTVTVTVDKKLYGTYSLDTDITVDIRGNRAAECEDGCQKAAEVLLGGLPSGIRPGELRWEALKWEKATGMFLRKGSLRCQAVFVAESQEDGEIFLDFILKGVMQD